jgi:hypothetical protein
MQDDRTALSSCRFLVDQMKRAIGVPYAEAGLSPVNDWWIQHAARHLNTVLEVRELPKGIYEIATPGYLGNAVIAIRKGLPTNEKRFALRHGLAHLLGGELDECEAGQVRFMSSVLDLMSLEERRADLFALVDMVPDHWIVEVPTLSAADLEYRIAERIRVLLPSWPTERVKDRARLRAKYFAGSSEVLP